MEEPDAFETGAHVGVKRRVECRFCTNETRHTVRASLTNRDPVFDDGVSSGYVEIAHELVECDGCQEISYRKSWIASNEDPDSDLNFTRQQIFPQRRQGRRRIAFALPKPIEAIYAETFRALCDDSRILAGIGIRAILEIVCNKKGAKTGKLNKKIDKLVTLGVLSANDAKVLHRLRDLGNDAAHQLRAPSAVALGLAMDVIEHLLRQLYYVDGPDIRKHLPRKRWPNPASVTAAVTKATPGRLP